MLSTFPQNRLWKNENFMGTNNSGLWKTLWKCGYQRKNVKLQKKTCGQIKYAKNRKILHENPFLGITRQVSERKAYVSIKNALHMLAFVL